MISYQIERWSTFYPDAAPLFQAEHDELGTHRDRMAFDPDLDRISSLDCAGVLLIATARDDGELIGYSLFMITPSLEYRTLLCAQQSVWFVRSDYRWSGRVGDKVFDFAIAEMKRRGVQCIHTHHRVRDGGERLAIKMKRRRAEPLEASYTIWIGD